MEEILNSLLNIEVIAKIAALVFVSVQGLKVFKVVETEAGIAKAAFVTALVAGSGLAVGELYAPAAPFIALFFSFYIGSLVAALGYRYLVGPFFEKFGVPMSTKDLK